MAKTINLYVRRYADDSIAHTIDVTSKVGQTIRGQDAIEVVMRGLLRQMNTDEYYVDDREVGLVEIEEGE